MFIIKLHIRKEGRKNNMKTISIINQKGGVGKTTTAQALAAGLTRKGLRVLSIDLDGQGNLTLLSGHDKATISAGTSDILKGKATTLDQLAIPTPQGDLIPATADLAAMERELANQPAADRTRKWIKVNGSGYDFILIDTPPALGILAINALVAADYVVIPTQADIFGLQGIGQLYQTIETVRQAGQPSLEIMGILATRYNARTNLTKQITTMLEDTAAQIGTRVFETKIRECTAIKEAQAVGENIFDYAPRSNGAMDYGQFTDEFLKEVKA
jgi:chromosome partitioning protein